MDESRIVKMMFAYRTDGHAARIMHVVAGAMSPDDIKMVAHYIATQPAAPEPK
jgi:cytochrome c553